MAHYLAQFNIARFRTYREDPALADFFAGIDVVNALAEASEGFVWRMKDEDGDSDSRITADERLVANLSVWTDIEALKRFSYRSEHSAYFRRRKEWFERMEEASYVLWWIPVDHTPSLTEAMDRLETLRKEGAGPEAFTFSTPHPAPTIITQAA